MSPRRWTLRRLLQGLLVLAVLCEIVWLVGANWALSSEWVTGKINERPEKLEVSWNRARTVLPGVVVVEDLAVRGQSRSQQWYVALDRARVHLSLLALAGKTFRTYSLTGERLDFRLRKRQPVGGEPGKQSEFTPEIPGLAIDAPVESRPVRKAKKRRPWRLRMGDIHIEDLEQIWVLAYRLTGRGSIHADVEVELGGGPLGIPAAKVDLWEAAVAVDNQVLGEELTLTVDARLQPFLPHEVKGAQVLRLLSGDVAIEGRTTTAGLINGLLADVESVRVGSPGGNIEARLRFEGGFLKPGTDLRIASSQGWVEVFDWRVEGDLQLHTTVDRREDTVRTTSKADLNRLQLLGDPAREAIVDGGRLGVVAEAGELDLAGGAASLAAALADVTLDLQDARIADVARLPVPPVEGLSLSSGELKIASHMVIGREGSDGSVTIDGEGIGATFGEIQMVGNLGLDLQVSSQTLAQHELKIEPSQFSLDQVSIRDGDDVTEDWYLYLDLEDGRARFARPRSLFAKAGLRMRDTRPLLTILGQEKRIVDRLQGILNFEDVAGAAAIEMTRDTVEIEDLVIDSEGLELMTNLQLVDKQVSGIVYLRFHGLPIAFDLREGGHRIVLSKPKRWYEAQSVPWAGQ